MELLLKMEELVVELFYLLPQERFTFSVELGQIFDLVRIGLT
jgi:hypothetical protein